LRASSNLARLLDRQVGEAFYGGETFSATNVRRGAHSARR